MCNHGDFRRFYNWWREIANFLNHLGEFVFILIIVVFPINRPASSERLSLFHPTIAAKLESLPSKPAMAYLFLHLRSFTLMWNWISFSVHLVWSVLLVLKKPYHILGTFPCRFLQWICSWMISAFAEPAPCIKHANGRDRQSSAGVFI